MIGQPSMEAAALGGYVRRVAELHPDAAAPGVYRTEGLFGDARRLRAQIGDEQSWRGAVPLAPRTGAPSRREDVVQVEFQASE